MNCADFEQLIALEVGGDLSARESAQLAGHLERCVPCRQLSAEMSEDLDWLRNMHQAPADRAALHQVRTSVMRQLEAEQGRWKGPWGRWLPLPWVWQVVAASAALALLIGGAAWWRAESGAVPAKTQVTQGILEAARSQAASSAQSSLQNDAADKKLPAPAPAKTGQGRQPDPQQATAEKQIVASAVRITKPPSPVAGAAGKRPAGREALRATPVNQPEAEPAAMELVHVALEPKLDEPASEAVMVKIPTSNPDIIVYWLMDEANKGD